MKTDCAIWANGELRYAGVNDHEIDLFEGQYAVPHGVSYNSYVILDEKTAVMDTVDGRFADAWLRNVEKALDGRKPDYLIVQHMEPDHSGSIMAFAEKYPGAVIVSTQKAFGMMNQFFGTDFADRRMVAAEGGKLPLGRHTLAFYTAPMVHWPEVMVTYEETEKTLFSADAFGKFGALDWAEDWTDEARRYYIGIVGKYGAPVQTLLKKAAGLDIQKICPLHGPVLKENLEKYLKLYSIWSSYQPEEKGAVIAYASFYGHTRAAAELLAEELQKAGFGPVVLRDVYRDDWAATVADAFRYSHLVVASPTYNGDMAPKMEAFLKALSARGYQNRVAAVMDNGTWAPMAGKAMKAALESCRNVTVVEPVVSIRSAMNDENKAQICALAAALIQA